MDIATLKKTIASSQEKSLPELHELIVLVYGDKKVGKSTFASRFPKPLFLDCEGAIRSVRAKDGKAPAQVRIHSWSKSEPSIIGTTQALLNSTPAETGIQTVVVDGLNEAYEYLRREVLATHKVEFENDGVLGYGKGSGIMRNKFRAWFADLRLLTEKGYGIVLCAHDTQIEFEHNNVKFNKRVPLIDGGKDEKAWTAIKPSIDLVIHATKTQGKDGVTHTMRCKGNNLIEAADPTVDARLPELTTFSYDALEQAYGKN